MTPFRVAAVVVTHNRREVLAETLRAARAQTRPPDRIYVVDNASDDGTGEILRADFPDLLHMRNAENLGCSGGLARGIEAAAVERFDAYWLLDDDSPPQPDALATLLAAAESSSKQTGIIGCRGGVVRLGLIRHIDDPRRLTHRQRCDGLFAADFVLLDGSLVLARVVDEIGLPRADYFTMLEDVEYSLRAGQASFDVLMTGQDLVRRKHLGSAPGSGVWRGYYQARNHLRMALDFRSPVLLFGWVARQARSIVAALRAPDCRWQRIRLRTRGTLDALRGRMGRRVEPESSSLGTARREGQARS
jgi:rhamnopyranosyl-N-acetylglucosaminyl-diphospho-decaprenol beta-1,3/1,4-galactofuranosyltransferase